MTADVDLHEHLKVVGDYVERSTHWREGGATRHDAKVAIDYLVDGIERAKQALHQISLCGQNSMSSKEECGRIARAALGAAAPVGLPAGEQTAAVAAAPTRAMRAALEEALEYIEQNSQADGYGLRDHDHDRYERYPLIDKLRAALAQPEPESVGEPFGYVVEHTYGLTEFVKSCPYLDTAISCTPVWDAPPAPQPPQPLADEQIAQIVRDASKGSAIRRDGTTSTRIARAVEAAHGITAPKGPT